MTEKGTTGIVSMMMDLQNRENTNLPLYEHQLQEVNAGIQNVLNAISRES